MSAYWRPLGCAALLISASGALASETITNSYDALGRLIQAAHTGPISGGVVTCYTYDAADNRTRVVAANVNCTTPVPPSLSINNDSATEGGTVVFTVTKTRLTSS